MTQQSKDLFEGVETAEGIVEEIIAEFHPKFEGLFRPKRHKVFYGGRAGLKSWSIAMALVGRARDNPVKILCTRELQKSIEDSVYTLLKDTINRLGFEDEFIIQANKITHHNGAKFIFDGLRNATALKSLEGADIVWCEEAENISADSWTKLLPTIRKSDSEVWVTFNPEDEMDATYQRFITPFEKQLSTNGVYEDERYYICKTSYRDNKWLSQVSRDDMEELKAKDYIDYLHVWEGEPVGNYEGSIIKPEWINAAIDAHIKLKWDIRGIRVTGFDPADNGADKKALASRYGSLVTNLNQWGTGDLEQGVETAYRAALLNKSSKLVFDSIGIGAGARIKFRQMKGNIQVIGFCASSSVNQPNSKYKDDIRNKDVFRNLRAQYYWYLRDRFENTYRAIEYGEEYEQEEMISLSSGLPYLKQLRSELSKVKRKDTHSSNGLIQIESKADMAKRGMKSPNLADALVYTFSECVAGRSITQRQF